jgi:hypothetical protein
MFNFPKILEDLRRQSKLELQSLLNSGLPWLKLDLDIPQFTDDILQEAVTQATNWRDQWKMVETNYQVNEWNGTILFGPSDWVKFSKIISEDNLRNDEDHLCMIHRNNLEFDWTIATDHPIRRYVESIFPNKDDINIVNYYVLPPGGYLFPHLDTTVGDKALNKIYIPLRWAEGNEFGFYKWGNMPVQEGKVYLINNYKYAHWVLNDSQEPRIVLVIGANLDSIYDIIAQSFAKNSA